MTQPTEQQTTGRELPIGTGVRFNTLTGTVDSPDLTVLTEGDSPAAWVGALVRLNGDPAEGHARIGTVRSISPDGWALVAGQFTGNLAWAYPLDALERIRIVVLP